MSQHSPPYKVSGDALEATRAAAHSAKLAMIAAVVSGVLALAGTILGGFIAGQSASNTVQQQLSGETERSKAEFLRTQQRELYASVTKHHISLSKAELAVLGSWRPEQAETDEARKNADSNYFKSRNSLDSDGALVAILASARVRSAYMNLMSSHYDLYLKLDDFKVAVRKGSDRSEASKEIGKSTRAINDAYAEFLVAARIDMGVR